MPPKRAKPSQSQSQDVSRMSQAATQAGPSQENSDSTYAKSNRISSDEMEVLVNKCVRYFIYRTGSNAPIRKADLLKTVLHGAGRYSDKVVERAAQIMDRVYGLKVAAHDQSASTKLYFVSNSLNHRPELYEADDHTAEDETNLPEDIHRVLILLILSHIFMSGTPVPETSLMSFLSSLDIDLDRRHSLFGNVRNFLSNVMIKHKYLITETDEITRKLTYIWGPKAESEVSKHEVLKFVCQMYGGRNPSTWVTQFEEAVSQPIIRRGDYEGEDIGERGEGVLTDDDSDKDTSDS